MEEEEEGEGRRGSRKWIRKDGREIMRRKEGRWRVVKIKKGEEEKEGEV